MKFLSIRDLRINSSKIWKSLPREREYVVTNNGRPIAILSAVGDNDLEESLKAIRRCRALETVTAMQLDSQQRGTDQLTMGDIDAEIATVRKARSE